MQFIWLSFTFFHFWRTLMSSSEWIIWRWCHTSITREAPGYAPLGTGQIFVPESIHVPGYLNLVADFLLRQKFRSGEWMLNRRTVAQIWEHFCAADVDQFTFMHLVDAFIQSDLQCIQTINVLVFLTVHVFPGN